MKAPPGFPTSFRKALEVSLDARTHHAGDQKGVAGQGLLEVLGCQGFFGAFWLFGTFGLNYRVWVGLGFRV